MPGSQAFYTFLRLPQYTRTGCKSWVTIVADCLIGKSVSRQFPICAMIPPWIVIVAEFLSRTGRSRNEKTH